jgi:outer membrane scaffolding protein for murein synthesis (MipA/OmpV family)
MQALLTTTFLSLSMLAGAAHAADTAVPEAGTTIGFGVGVAPEYKGSDHHRAFPLLVADYQNANGFFASSYRGLGYVTAVDGVKVSAALQYAPGRNKSNLPGYFRSDSLKGMGQIDDSLVANLGAAVDLAGYATFSANTQLALSNRERGNSYQFGLSKMIYQSASDQVTLKADTEYGDRRHVQTFYGVTAAQSATSGFRPFTAKAGFEQATLGVAWNHVIDKSWSVYTMAGVSRQLGDAANSPLTKSKTSPALISAVNYRF